MVVYIFNPSTQKTEASILHSLNDFLTIDLFSFSYDQIAVYTDKYTNFKNIQKIYCL